MRVLQILIPYSQVSLQQGRLKYRSAMINLSEALGKIYDVLENKWNGPTGHRFAGGIVVLCFIGSLLLVEVKKLNMFQGYMPGFIPDTFLAAIEAALTLVLIIEVMGLVFSIVNSVTSSVGRQLEILSLILLRDVFKEISHIKEPVVWGQLTDAMLPIVATSISALVIFAILGFFYKLKKRVDIKGDEGDKQSFITSKKIISLILLFSFQGILINSLYCHFTGEHATDIFESFYTLLIISDILIVLISMRYGHDYQVAFRNSGFAVVTVFIRIALIAPPVFSAIIGSGTALFALAVLCVFNNFTRLEKN